MYSKPLECKPFLLSRQVGEVLGGDRWPARVVGRHGLRWRGLSRERSEGNTGEGPDLEQGFLGAQRTDPVRGGAAVLGQQKVVREAEIDRFDDAAPLQLVEVGDVTAPGPMPMTMASLRVLRQMAIAAAGSAGSSMFCRPSAMRMSFSWVMPAMPSPRVRMKYRLVWRQSRWFGRRAGLRGRQQLGMGLRDVVALHERGRRQLPIHRKPARLPPLDAQRLHLPGVIDGRERLEAVAQRWGVVIEVDPRTATPELTSDRNQAEIVRVEVVLVELLGP